MLSRVGAQIRKAEGVPRLQELCLGYTASKESRQAMKLPLLLLLATVARAECSKGHKWTFITEADA